jgi:hypothetical protein
MSTESSPVLPSLSLSLSLSLTGDEGRGPGAIRVQPVQEPADRDQGAGREPHDGVPQRRPHRPLPRAAPQGHGRHEGLLYPEEQRHPGRYITR